MFFTPAIVSGTADMPPHLFAFWNLVDVLGSTVSVAASVYGVGRLVTGHHGAYDIVILIIGLAAGALGAIVVVRRHRRHTARRLAAAADGPPHDVS